ncbi:hypothetical protein [Phyllobacterium leguminum]|nr:hypothetical protein [Phyllobacterium leguminum]
MSSVSAAPAMSDLSGLLAGCGRMFSSTKAKTTTKTTAKTV